MQDSNETFTPVEPTSEANPYSPFTEESAQSAQQPTVRNVKDLVNTLARMNQKINELEAENRALHKELEGKAGKKDVVTMLSNVESLKLPKNGLMSDNFLIRAISVYGHWFVANFVISIIFTIIFFIFFAALFEQIASNLVNSGI